MSSLKFVDSYKNKGYKVRVKRSDFLLGFICYNTARRCYMFEMSKTVELLFFSSKYLDEISEFMKGL